MAIISIRLKPESRRYLRRLVISLDRAQIYSNIFSLLDKQGALTAGYITKNYLSSQRLNRITGTLARSVVGLAEDHKGLPAMRIGVLAGPALVYAGILEFGTQDFNPLSPYTFNKHGQPLKGRVPRWYIRDGMEWGLDELTRKLEGYIAALIEGDTRAGRFIR